MVAIGSCMKLAGDDTLLAPYPKMHLEKSGVWNRDWELDEARVFLNQVCKGVSSSEMSPSDTDEGGAEKKKTIQGSGNGNEGDLGSDDNETPDDDGDLTGSGNSDGGGGDYGDGGDDDDDESDDDIEFLEEEEEEDDYTSGESEEIDEEEDDDVVEIYPNSEESDKKPSQGDTTSDKGDADAGVEVNATEKSISLDATGSGKKKLEKSERASSPDAKKQKLEN